MCKVAAVNVFHVLASKKQVFYTSTTEKKERPASISILLLLLLFISFNKRNSLLSSRLTALMSHVNLNEWLYTFIVRICLYPPKWCTNSTLWLSHGWCHAKLLPSRRKFCVHHLTMHRILSVDVSTKARERALTWDRSVGERWCARLYFYVQNHLQTGTKKWTFSNWKCWSLVDSSSSSSFSSSKMRFPVERKIVQLKQSSCRGMYDFGWRFFLNAFCSWTEGSTTTAILV